MKTVDVSFAGIAYNCCQLSFLDSFMAFRMKEEGVIGQ